MSRLIVYTAPVAKARARVTVQNGKARAYTPSTTKQAEWFIRTSWVAEHGATPKEGPLSVSAVAYVQMPKSLPKSRRLTAMPTTRPDCDNYLKLLLDSLLGVAWKDDNQVVDVHFMKRYALDSAPRWEIEVTEATV